MPGEERLVTSSRPTTVLGLLRSISDSDVVPAVFTPSAPPLSRRELLDRVDVGAAVLRSSVGTVLVGVCLPEGIQLATSVLAALGAGGAAPVRAGTPENAIAAHFSRTRVGAVVAPVGSTAAHVAEQMGLPVLVPHDDEIFHPYRPARALPYKVQADIADLAIVLTTSGTTGEPKVVPLRHGNLLSSIERVGTTLTLTPTDRSLVVMPLTHIHGLVAGLLAPLGAGGAVFLDGRFDPAMLPARAAEFGATFLTAVPTIHRALVGLSTDEDVSWAQNLRFLRSSSSALPSSVAAALDRRYGVPVVEAYGMTEGAHQITSNDPADPRRGTVGPADAERVRVIGPDGRDVAPTTDGDVVIRGDNVMGGYLGDAEVSEAAFVDGWFRTGDVGRVDADGHLVLVGRTKEMINRGGETIAPGPIEEVVRAIEGVRDAAVFAAPHPTLGEQVAVAVVGARDLVPQARLRLEVGRCLGEDQIPRIVHWVDAIPVGPTGKVQRNLLPELLAAPASPRSVGSFTSVGHEVVASWRNVGLDPTSSEDDFIALGGDSLVAIAVAYDLAERWGVDVRPADLLRNTTISGMAELRFRPRVGSGRRPATEVQGPTATQRRMLAADRLGIDPGSANMAFAWLLAARTDPARLRRAVERVIARHPALRSAFVIAPTIDYQPLSIERSHVWIDGGVVADLDEATGAFAAVAAESYDLVDGPLLRFGVWSLGSTGQLLFGFAYHHVVLDGRSRRIVLDDLGAAFAGDSSGSEIPRARSLHSSMEAIDRSWWADRFRTVPLELDWTTRVVGLGAGARPTVQRFDLSEATIAGLRRLCVAHQATPTMVLVAATAIGLHRLTGNDEVAVGLAIDHRLPVSDESVGVTMDSVPVVVDLSGGRSVGDLLARVRRECLEVYERSGSGLEGIRTAVGRGYGEPILHARAQVRTEADHLALGELPVEPLLLDPVVARAPVNLDLRLVGDSARLEVILDPRVIEAGVAPSHARSFASILDSLVSGSERRVDELDWVSAHDLAVVDRWGSGQPGEPAFATIDAWFRASATKWPHRPAVRSFDCDLTFAELDESVARVASALADLTSAGERIASILPTGVDQVVLQLAAWRIGVAVVAVDVEGPEKRTVSQIVAAAVRLVVADGRGTVPSEHETVVFDDLMTMSEPGELPTRPDAEMPAWGCLTSGSTGEPNVVIGTQSHLVHLVHAWLQAIPPEAHGLATVSKPPSAVGFLSEWLAPLLSGNPVFFFNPVTARDPFRIATRLKEFGVTWYRGTPAMLHAVALQVLSHDGPNRGVRLVVSGADRLRRETADLLVEAFPRAVILNQYGCTEATAESTMGRVGNGAREPDVGRPLANVRVELIDARGHRVPPGVRGEIVLHGPLVTGSGGRGHCSGDFGWWDGDGRLHYVGRRDSRLSVNGNRINAGDVEAALVSTGLVGSAIVMVDPRASPLGTSLAAVVTVRGPHSASDIRSAVAGLLPSYAVPNRLESVDELPMLASGKTDQRRAQAMLARRNGDTEVVPLPARVADIRAVVSTVLGRPPSTIDTTRSLQANGGDSFAAISLQEQLFTIRGVRLDIAALVDDRPLADLATNGVVALGGPLPGRLRRVSLGQSSQRLIWFPGGGGLDVEVRRLVHYLALAPEVLAYPYPGAEVGERPAVVFRRLVARIVRTLESLGGPRPLIAGNSFGGIVAVEVARRLQRRRPGWIEGLLVVDAMPIEQRRRARAGRTRADVRGLLADRGRNDEDPAVRWRRNFRASRIMLDTHRRSGTVSGVPTVVVATSERRRLTGRADLGWGDHLGNSVSVIELPGDHGGLLVEPKVLATARAVSEALRILAGSDR